MRVLYLPSFYVTPERPICGTFFQEQALAVRNVGVDVDVVFVEQRSLRELSPQSLIQSRFQITTSDESGLRTVRCRGWSPFIRTIRGSLVWSRWTRRLVERYIREFGRPDLIHAHNALWGGFAAEYIARTHGIPYVVTEHSTLFTMGLVTPRLRQFVEQSYSGSSAIVAVGDGLAKAIRPFTGNKVPEIIPNLVHTGFFTLPPTPVSSRPFRFLGVGHLTERKGFDILIRAFARNFHGNPDVKLDIGGDGPERARLAKLCSELGLSSSVRLLGGLSREQVRERMWCAHCFVLPSMQETFGVVLIEALAAGLPVIATRGPGPEDIVDPRVGLLVTPGNVEELAEALELVRVRNYSPTELREYATRRYGADVVAHKLVQVYERVLSLPAVVPVSTMNHD